MTRVACTIAVATIAYMAISGITKAATIAPLPPAATSNANDPVPIYYWHGSYYPYRWHGGYYHHRSYRNGSWRYW